jgi:uncharacterized LabA/DUF88 family protein
MAATKANRPQGLWWKHLHTLGLFYIQYTQLAALKNMKQKRAILFIDGNNFYHGLGRGGFLPMKNYKRISEKLTEKRGHQWLQTRFYIGIVQQEENTDLYDKQRGFLSQLENQGNRIKQCYGSVKKVSIDDAAQELEEWLEKLQKNPKPDYISCAAVEELKEISQRRKYRRREKMVDVMIATDMVKMALEEKFDVAYLLSADLDFLPAVQTVRESGREVFVASPDHWAKALTQKNKENFILLDADFFAECKEA